MPDKKTLVLEIKVEGGKLSAKELQMVNKELGTTPQHAKATTDSFKAMEVQTSKVEQAFGRIGTQLIAAAISYAAIRKAVSFLISTNKELDTSLHNLGQTMRTITSQAFEPAARGITAIANSLNDFVRAAISARQEYINLRDALAEDIATRLPRGPVGLMLDMFAGRYGPGGKIPTAQGELQGTGPYVSSDLPYTWGQWQGPPAPRPPIVPGAPAAPGYPTATPGLSQYYGMPGIIPPPPLDMGGIPAIPGAAPGGPQMPREVMRLTDEQAEKIQKMGEISEQTMSLITSSALIMGDAIAGIFSNITSGAMSAGQALKRGILGALAAICMQMGQMFIYIGIACQGLKWLGLGGAGAIAAGAALMALGGAMQGASSGGGARAGGGGGRGYSGSGDGGDHAGARIATQVIIVDSSGTRRGGVSELNRTLDLAINDRKLRNDLKRLTESGGSMALA